MIARASTNTTISSSSIISSISTSSPSSSSNTSSSTSSIHNSTPTTVAAALVPTRTYLGARIEVARTVVRGMRGGVMRHHIGRVGDGNGQKNGPEPLPSDQAAGSLAAAPNGT
mmetsp:Transcript_27642/g.80779  ORF Transcript_27642/g.80779 Transcript_27642/m.80779 type:complete len:113 (+) Transcript_27642:823-1161(+)